MNLPLELKSVDLYRQTDYLFCYWQAGQGTFAWLVDRDQQLTLFVVFGMNSLRWEHWAYENERAKVDTVRRVMATMGFREMPVYSYMKSHVSGVKALLEDIRIFEETLTQQAEIYAKMKAEEEKKEKEKRENECPQPDPRSDNVNSDETERDQTGKVVSFARDSKTSH